MRIFNSLLKVVLLSALLIAAAARTTGANEVIPLPIYTGSDYLQNCQYFENRQNEDYYTVNMDVRSMDIRLGGVRHIN